MIDIPKRRNKRIRYFDQNVQLDDCDGPLRQIAVIGLGRGQALRVPETVHVGGQGAQQGFQRLDLRLSAPMSLSHPQF